MRARAWYYVCDRCGALETHTAQIAEGAEWSCPNCGSGAAWEFTDRRKALDHSAHIADIVRSGLFRTAS